MGVSILTILMSTIGVAMFQALGTQRRVVDDGLAVNELRKGLSWLAVDVRMAKGTDLADLAPAVSSVTFTWTDEFNNSAAPHTSSYALVGNRLVRTYDGSAHTVARRVLSVEFSRSDKTVTAQLELDAGAGTTRTISLRTLMRSASS